LPVLGSFDAVLMSHVLSTRDDLSDHLEPALDSTAPGGAVYIVAHGVAGSAWTTRSLRSRSSRPRRPYAGGAEFLRWVPVAEQALRRSPEGAYEFPFRHTILVGVPHPAASRKGGD
jgi:hypothetical protein